jgi:hypothetical protein
VSTSSGYAKSWSFVVHLMCYLVCSWFAMDSYVSRAGAVTGIGPRELLNETYFTTSTQALTRASPILLDMAADAWAGVATINTELRALMPMLFAPTSNASYSVSFGRNLVGNLLGTANTSATPIRTLRKHIPGTGDVLMAVNVDRAPLNARFVVPG